MSQLQSPGTRQLILDAAPAIFCEHGYRGASIRRICSHAGVSANAITYHFGSKKKLYQALLDGFAALQLVHAKAVLSVDPKSQQEFEIRLELFFTQLLEIYLENRHTLLIVLREFEQLLPEGDGAAVDELVKINFAISEFIERARKFGVVRADVDSEIVAGTLLDRLLSQARFAHTHKRLFKNTTLEPDYRRYWIRATLTIVFDGIRTRANPNR